MEPPLSLPDKPLPTTPKPSPGNADGPTPIFEATRFQGALSGNGHSISIGFDAHVDHMGVLQLKLDRIPFSAEAFALHIDGPPGTPVALLTLDGTSETGQEFHSDSFCINQFQHMLGESNELNYSGECFEAELKLPVSAGRKPHGDARVWLVRQLRTLRPLNHATLLGRVVISGPSQNADTQAANGLIAVYRLDDDVRDAWWADSERLLSHVARVLSFAYDIYLQPLIDQRYEANHVTVRIIRHGRAVPPYMAPFHELNMGPIFACACESYFTRQPEIEQLDPAIRWLTAPAVYDESRLIAAMSALESILDRCGLPGFDKYLGTSTFKRVASKIRELLIEHKVPIEMAAKIPELNRRTLDEKVEGLLAARGIAVADLPQDWLKMIIKQRNVIVHRGVSDDVGDQEPRAFDHTIWAREVVARIILERLGFEGAYFSWLHHHDQIHFPECIPMNEWVARQTAPTS